MTVRVFRSSDSGAPILSATVGSLNAVLTACLVTGYGSTTSLGWSKPFENVGTNTTVYRPAAGNRRYLRVIDTTATYSTCNIRAYESMTDENTGTKPFPTVTQITGNGSNGLSVHRAAVGYVSNCSWVIIGNEKCFYFLPNLNSASWDTITNVSAGGQFFFGDFISYKPGDIYNTAIIGTEATYTTSSSGRLGSAGDNIGCYMARPFIGLGSSAPFIKSLENSSQGYTLTMGYQFNYPTVPDPITGGIPLARVTLTELITLSYPNYYWSTAYAVRGYLPGMWAPSVKGLAHADTFNGDSSGVLSGKSFLVSSVFKDSTATGDGKACFEVSDTW